MTASHATGKRTDARREVKVAPNLYRQGGTDRYRFARMSDGVSVFERFTAPTLTEAKKHADSLRTREPSSFGDKSVTVEPSPRVISIANPARTASHRHEQLNYVGAC